MTKPKYMMWKCLTCGATKDVKSGVCPKDGPVQTKPMDSEAMKAAGVVESEPVEIDVPADVKPKG